MDCHPLVTQLRFARSEFVHCLDGVSAVDAVRRLGPMNCISWMVGHLANQEHNYWVMVGQDKIVVPGLNDLVGYGKPASSPPLDEMWEVWHMVTDTADKFLNTLSEQKLLTHVAWRGKAVQESILS